MDVRLEIRDTGEGLIAAVTASHANLLWRIPVEIAFEALLTVYWFRSTLPNISFFVLSGIFAFAILRDLVSLIWGTNVELVVTDSGLISSGHAPGGYSQRSIARKDIYNLKYKRAEGGGDFPETPAGLYVETYDTGPWTPALCVLPHLDETQTNQVIEAILRRFPDLPSGAPEPSGLISLNLNRPRARSR